jgi:Cu(I)/Ag(I) efflux system membrane fusion protein
MNTNRKTIITVISALALGLLLGGLIFSGSESKTVNEHQHDPGMAAETIWTCSMHPQIRQKEPGDCPICGMDLIPLASEQDNDIDPMAISMSPTAMQLANVSTALVGSADPVKSVRLNGKVQADERLVFSQSSHIPGRIEKLMVNFTGVYVNKGEEIASIYAPELVTAQEELFEAQKIKETQPQLFQAAKEKLSSWKLSNSQIEQILQSGASKESFAVQADVSGYVTQKKVTPGDYIRKGEAIFEIADLSKVWILFDVYESDMPWIKKGDQVSFTIASLPGETFLGTISYLDPVIDPKTRVAKARLEAINHGLKLKPEMFASGTVAAKLPKKSNNMMVPKTAVMWTGKRSVVYVKSMTEHGVNFMMREVTLGPALGDSYIIESGLKEGEEIAVNGTFSIDAAAQLAGKPSMMSPEGGPAMTGHSHGGMEIPAASEETTNRATRLMAVSQNVKNSMQPIYTQYLSFKDALVADNLAEAQKAAGNMQTALGEVDMSAFTGESHDAWMKYSTDLKNALQHVPHHETIHEVRKAFQKVSDAMIALTKTFKPFDKTLYIQYCPMANDNKGAHWLSQFEEIKSPYFGAAMPTCGETKSTIE